MISDNNEKPAPSPKDLDYAAELREQIHQKVLEKVQRVNPGIGTVPVRYKT